MNGDLKNLIIASFFHDIGKFIQRSKQFEETHEELSFLFSSLFEDGKKLKKYYFNLVDKDIDFSLIAKLCQSHHEKEKKEDNIFNRLLEIIQKADRLSASTQREIGKINSCDPSEINQKDIFNYLFSQGVPQKEYFHQIHSLIDLEKFLPEDVSKKNKNDNIRAYADLLGRENFGNLLSGFLFLKEKRNFLSFLYGLDDIFHLIYTQIPEDRRDTYQLNSLYDHLKLTTIFSFLFYYSDEFCLLKFDAAGIQKFIFDIKTKKAAKILRGRSLFIQLINEVIIFDIISSLNLIPQLNLSNYGGNSLLFLPKEEKILEKLEKILTKWQIFLLKEYGLNLRVNDYKKSYPLTQEFINNIFSTEDKDKKIDLSLFTSKDLFFLLENINEEIKPAKVDDTSLCDYCQNPAQIKSEDEKRCSSCHMFINLSDFIVKKQPFYWENQREKTILDFHNFFEKKITNTDQTIIFKPFENLLKQKENKKNYYPSSCSKTIFYTLTTPNKSFDEIVEKKEAAPLLMYLKGDVDDMSHIFSQGFDFREENGKKKKTITDLIHFSRRINIFFQNYLPYLIKKEDKFKENLYLVYSGGDDFFLIGYWQMVMEFIFKLKEKFNQFVCENPYLHFSLGGVLAKPHDPVYFISENVEEKLSLAKNNGKNQLAFLHSSLSLEDWREIYQQAKKINNKEVSSSFFYKIFQLSEAFLRKDDLRKDNYGKAIAIHKMSYHYYRLIGQWQDDDIEKKGLADFKNFFDDLLSLPRKEDNKIDFYQKNLKTIINLVLLLRRKGGEKND